MQEYLMGGPGEPGIYGLHSVCGYAADFDADTIMAWLMRDFQDGIHTGSYAGGWKIVSHLGRPCLVRFGGPGRSIGTFRLVKLE